MSGDPLQRAALLIDGGRPAEAMVELERALTEDPGDARAHGLMALALADLERFDEALGAARRAVGEAPEWSFAHHVNAQVLLRMGKAKRALEPAREAVALDPEDEDLHALVASCHVAQARWREGLEAAERGLALAPEDERCVNLRALCLRQLGQVDEAEVALRTSLAADPENAWTFQNLGFAALQSGDADAAVRHFRESLRLDPSDELSRQGLAEALKAKVPLYRPVIAWQMLCSRLSARMGLGLVVGFLILARVVRSAFPEGSPVGAGLLVVYGSFVWMSWAASALFDVLLLMRRDLRPILGRHEAVAGAGVLLCLLVAAAALAVQFATGYPGQHYTALAGAFAAIPVAGWVNLPNGNARRVGVLLAVGALATLLLAFGTELHVLSRVGWDMTSATSPPIPQAEFDELLALVKQGSGAAGISLLVSVASSWVLTGLGFVPEGRGGKGKRRRPR